MSDKKGDAVGCDWSLKQLEAIELFANGRSGVTVSETIGISQQQISTWRRNYQFMDAISKRARELLKEALPGLYDVAIKKALEGEHSHLKILLDHLDNIEKTVVRKSQASLTFVWDFDEGNDTIQAAPIPAEIP
jgi:transposase-like protein